MAPLYLNGAPSLGSLPAALLGAMLRNNLLISVPTHTWATTVVVGSGSATASAMETILFLGTTTASSVVVQNVLTGLIRTGSDSNGIDWTNKFWLFLDLARATAESLSSAINAYIQIKPATNLGILAEQGVGVMVDNMVPNGESYGASRDAVAASAALTSGRPVHIAVRFTPTLIQWFNNGTQFASQSTAAKIPTTTSGAIRIVVGLERTGGTMITDATVRVANMWLLQEIGG